jgi:carbon storage regulator
MLVLSRKVGEKVLIGGRVVVTVLAVRGGRVRLGITAPAEVCVRRGEFGPGDDPAPWRRVADGPPPPRR